MRPGRGPTIPGHRVECLDTVDSTNLEARRRLLAGRAGPGLVLLAGQQTSGRGRRGRRWHCVPGRSLAATLVLARPALARPSRVTLLSALAACQALEAAGSPPITIKWPNDLMRGEHKLGGILVEGLSDRHGAERLLVGVGINLCLRAGDLPAELAARATDAGLDPSAATRDAVLIRLLSGLEQALAEVGSAADAARGQEYARRSWLDGRRAELLFDGQPHTVQIAGLSADGDLRLTDGRRLEGERVELLRILPRR